MIEICIFFVVLVYYVSMQYYFIFKLFLKIFFRFMQKYIHLRSR